MPFANFKVPAVSLAAGQKEAVVHRATDLLAEVYGEAAPQHHGSGRRSGRRWLGHRRPRAHPGDDPGR